MINGLKIKMNIQISLTLILAASVISFQDEDEGNKTARKHYGLSFHSKCTDYVKSFTCMTTCKSIGFQVFRMDFRCKCSCHGLKTTTILPFFKWRTNGTTKALPQTHSPNLYHVAGTLSPARTASTEETSTAPNVTCAPPQNTTLNASNDTTTDDNTTSVDDDDTTGDATNVTDTSDTGADGNGTTVDDGATAVDDGDATTADGDVTTTGEDATTVDGGAAAAVDDGATTTVAEGDAPDNAAPDDAPAAED